MGSRWQAGLIVLLASLPAGQLMAQDYAVPPGFEALMEPQETLVDVYFGDRLVLSTPARYSPEEITFLEPDALIGAMPQVKPEPWLLAVLSTPLDPHGDKVCVSEHQQECGLIEPKVAGVIFDEQRFRADLFIHPKYLEAPEALAPRYLPEPTESRWGGVQNLSFSHAGSAEGENNTSLFGRSLVGRGAQYGFANWVSTDEQSLSIDELGWQRNYPDHQLTVGLFQPNSDMLTVIDRQPIAGVGVSRSLVRRQDLDSAFATSVEVFLSSRSRIEVYKDGRLYGSQFLESGRRRLDTARLPTGAYTLELRITDANGNTRVEEQFFVKSRRLAPQGEKLWFAQVGQATAFARDQVLPEDRQTALLMTGLRQRFADTWGGGVAMAATGEQALLEVSGDWFSRYSQLFASTFVESEGGGGFTLRGNARYRDWRFQFDSQRVWTDDPTVFDVDFDAREYRLLPRSVRRDSAELWVPAGRGQLVFSHRRQRLGRASEQTISSAAYLHTFRVGGGQVINLSASLTRNNGDNQILLGANWLMTRPDWQHQANLGWVQDDAPGTEDGVNAAWASAWNDRDRFDADLTLGAGVNFDPGRQSVLLNSEYGSRHGRGRADVAFNDSDRGGRDTLTSVRYDTSLVIGDGAALGGEQLNDSAVLLKLNGAEGALFDVLVNGNPEMVVKGGSSATLTLPAYQVHKIALRDRGTDFVNLDSTPRDVVLYPGNVAMLAWELQRVMVAIGRLQDADGNTLSRARIQGPGFDNLVFTDQDGYFQLELPESSLNSLYVETASGRCNLQTGAVEIQYGVARLGAVVCEAIDN
ncbi:TcfC E-set like domain-containing protein [Alcanivorax sp.]|uniref:TcfC E-set like domain-containing protein n=1 Tax=Alcanivorax sp. TaxID=1872427 RepID=UPI002627AA72|nr:TcfC E-set like domain-containing protein [Alcanivorax sp.]